MDDLGSAEIWEKVEAEYSCLGLILSDSGVDEAKEKACTPNWLMIFLGILVNTRALTLEVTPDRLVEISELLVGWCPGLWHLVGTCKCC